MDNINMPILVCDDSKLQSTTFKKILEDLGFEVFVSNNLSGGRAHYLDIRAAFIDANIEGTFDGVELIREMKSLNPSIKAFLLTGESSEQLEKHQSIMDEVGVDAVLSKMARKDLSKATNKLLVEHGILTGPDSTTVAKINTPMLDRASRLSSVINETKQRQSSSAIEFQLEHLTKKIDRLRDKVSDLESEHQPKSITGIEALNSQIIKLDKSLSQKIKNLTKKVDDCDDQVRDIDQRSINSDIESLSAEFNESQNLLDAKVKKIEQKVDVMKALEKRVNQLLSEMKSSPPSKISDKNDSFCTDQELVDKILPTLQKIIDEQLGDIKIAYQEIETIKGSILEDTPKIFAKLMAEQPKTDFDFDALTTLQQSLFEQKKDSVKLIKRIESKCEELTTVEDTISTLVSPIEQSLKQSADQYKLELKSLTEKVANQIEDVKSTSAARIISGEKEIFNNISQELEKLTAKHKSNLQLDLQETVKEMTVSEGGLATSKNSELFINKRLDDKVIYFREVVNESQNELLSKNKQLLLDMIADVKPSTADIERAVGEVAKSGLTRRVKQRIAPDMLDLARVEVIRLIKEKIFSIVITSVIVSSIASLTLFYFAWPYL